jgi:hypothetical protein
VAQVRAPRRALLPRLKSQGINESGCKSRTRVCGYERQNRSEQVPGSAARGAAGEAERSVLQQRARRKEAGAVEELVRIFELPSLEKHAGTVAEQAQTRSTTHDDVSAGGGRGMRRSSTQARAERLEAAVGTDLLDRFSHDDVLCLTDVPRPGWHQLLRASTTDQPGATRCSLLVRWSSGGPEWSRRADQIISA